MSASMSLVMRPVTHMKWNFLMCTCIFMHLITCSFFGKFCCYFSFTYGLNHHMALFSGVLLYNVFYMFTTIQATAEDGVPFTMKLHFNVTTHFVHLLHLLHPIWCSCFYDLWVILYIFNFFMRNCCWLLLCPFLI